MASISRIELARLCHEVNRAYCQALGDDSQLPWEEAPEWQRDSALAGVNFTIDNPDAPASATHDAWLEHKLADGWQYGKVKDADKKTHPCILPYEELPVEQRAKDHIFRAIIKTLV
jgi:hypothetical protein